MTQARDHDRQVAGLLLLAARAEFPLRRAELGPHQRLLGAGGYVFITRGLYNALPDDQAVLAHEISHVTKRHALKVISRGEFMKGLFDAGGSVSNVGAFDQGVASITDSLFSKGFDPSAEFEADKEGRSLASKVGYDRSALLDFLKGLYAKEGDSKDAFPTHPPLSHRIQRLQN